MDEQNIIIKELDGTEKNILNAERKTVQIARTGIFICSEGEVDLRLNDTDYHIQPNSLIVYFPYSHLRINKKTGTLKGLLIGGDLEMIQPFLYKVSNFSGLFHIRNNPHIILHDITRNRILSLIDLISQNMETMHCEDSAKHNDSPVKRIIEQQTRLLSHSLMLEIVNSYSTVSNPITAVNRRDEVLQIFLSDLYTNYRKNHEVKFYADRQCLTSRYFSAIIRERSGKTPSEWISTALLVEAKQLVTNSTISIKEISERLYFPNQSYFGKWFKNLTGVGPLEFRYGHGLGQETEEKFDSFVSVSLTRK